MRSLGFGPLPKQHAAASLGIFNVNHMYAPSYITCIFGKERKYESGAAIKKIPTSHKRSIATCWLYEGEFWRSSRSHIKRGCHINNEGDFFERGRRREYLFFFSEEIFLREVDGENIYFSLARRFFLRRHTKKRYFF